MTQNALPPIQMLWVGESISQLEHLCMQSFLSNGHPVHLYTYNPVKNVPEGVTCLDASTIIAKESIFLHKGSYACFADLFRWQLLVEKGGYYCDTDMLCLKPFDFSEEALIGLESYQQVNIAVLKFPAQHPICQEMLDCAKHPLKIKPYDTRRVKRKKLLKRFSVNTHSIGWGETAGPPAMSRIMDYIQATPQVTIKDFTHFYPISAGNWDALFDDTLSHADLFENTYAVHLWNEMMRRSDIDKNAPINPSSFVGQSMQKYCPNYIKQQ